MWFINLIKDYHQLIFEGIINTLILALLGTFLGLCIAILIAIAGSADATNKENRFTVLKKIISFIARGFITIFRGTPMIVQAMIIYYGLVSIFSTNNFLLSTPLYCGIFIITINTSAYIGEVLRMAIINFDKGQTEAGKSLGLSNFTILFNVIIPQVLRQSVPSIGNELIVNIKDSSVLMIIGVVDLFKAMQSIGAKTFDITNTFIVAALIYLILTFAANRVLYLINKVTAPKHRLSSGGNSQ